MKLNNAPVTMMAKLTGNSSATTSTQQHIHRYLQTSDHQFVVVILQIVTDFQSSFTAGKFSIQFVYCFSLHLSVYLWDGRWRHQLY